jgi:hypothetical protein
MSNSTTTPPAAIANPEVTPLTIEDISQRILLLRGQRVILDADLAAFYGETTKRFNQQVNRNLARFPADFMFQLSSDEFDSLRLQFATLKTGRGQHRKYAPLAFSEHGAIMAAMLLGSPRAVEISVHVVRAFVELRSKATSHQELSTKLRQLERKVTHHDQAINHLMDSMQALLAPPATPKRQIGFITDDAPLPKAKSKALTRRAALS